MKPTKIFIVRHGQSLGNVDKSVYATTPDYAVPLTETGHKQAEAAGKELARRSTGGDFFFYVSPFRRTKETFLDIAKSIPREKITYREEVRLREQEWSGRMRADNFDETMGFYTERERDAYSRFYYRFEGGESCADVFDRVSGMLDTVHRDFEKPNFPDNCVFVGHGMTMRVMLMRWFHWTVEEFELLKNPPNCHIVELNLDIVKQKYSEPELDKYPSHTHDFHFPLRFDN